MKPTIHPTGYGHVQAVLKIDDYYFDGIGPTEKEALEELRFQLRRNIARGNASQKALYYLTDPEPQRGGVESDAAPPANPGYDGNTNDGA